MGLGLLLIPAIAGYYFLSNLFVTKHWLDQHDSYHVVFSSSFAGAILLGAAYFLTEVISEIFSCYERFIDITLPSGSYDNYYDVVIVSFILGIVSPKILNVFLDTRKALYRILKQEGNWIEMVAYQAMEKNIPVALTLQDRKVYIGNPLGLSPVRKPMSDISIIPLASGHREEATGELVLDINYAHIIHDVINDEEEFDHIGFEDFLIAIPMSEVVSARLFDWGVYARFMDDIIEIEIDEDDEGSGEDESDGDNETTWREKLSKLFRLWGR